MSSDKTFTNHVTFYQWELQRFSDMLSLHCSLETSMVKKLSGEYLDATEESSRELSQTAQQRKKSNMSQIKEQDRLMLDAIMWLRLAQEEVRKAGGNPDAVLGQLPDELLTTMIRNRLAIKYAGR